MKDELGGQIMKEFVGLRVKTYSYEGKKAKGTKKSVIKRKLKLKIIKTVSKQLKLSSSNQK